MIRSVAEISKNLDLVKSFQPVLSRMLQFPRLGPRRGHHHFEISKVVHDLTLQGFPGIPFRFLCGVHFAMDLPTEVFYHPFQLSMPPVRLGLLHAVCEDQ